MRGQCRPRPSSPCNTGRFCKRAEPSHEAFHRANRSIAPSTNRHETRTPRAFYGSLYHSAYAESSRRRQRTRGFARMPATRCIRPSNPCFTYPKRLNHWQSNRCIYRCSSSRPIRGQRPSWRRPCRSSLKNPRGCEQAPPMSLRA